MDLIWENDYAELESTESDPTLPSEQNNDSSEDQSQALPFIFGLVFSTADNLALLIAVLLVCIGRQLLVAFALGPVMGSFVK